MNKVKNGYAVVIAGGSGERLWPLSTPETPKQFLKILGGTSLLRQAVLRVLPLVPLSNVLIVTSQAFAKQTQKELPELPGKNILLEPCRKNTGPAIAVALGEIRRRGGEDALVAILTADQVIAKSGTFRTLLRQAYQTARARDVVVTLGVKPTYPSTGFGYIDAVRKRFVEKPDSATARRYLKTGQYVWNAGMFIFRCGALQSICRAVALELATLSDAVKRARTTRGLLARLYPKLTNISFDYAVMEKTDAIEVVSGDFGWDDVGGYTALASHLPADVAGNVSLGSTRALDCTGCTLFGMDAHVSAFGLKDVVVVAQGGNVLVMPRACAADLKRLLRVPQK